MVHTFLKLINILHNPVSGNVRVTFSYNSNPKDFVVVRFFQCPETLNYSYTINFWYNSVLETTQREWNTGQTMVKSKAAPYVHEAYKLLVEHFPELMF